MVDELAVALPSSPKLFLFLLATSFLILLRPRARTFYEIATCLSGDPRLEPLLIDRQIDNLSWPD